MTSLFKNILQKIDPTRDLKEIEPLMVSFISKLKKELINQKVKADVFIGGSFAKRTMIKKELYDVDVFLRFNKKYNQLDISNMTEKILKKSLKDNKKIKRIHGSRDYFQIDFRNEERNLNFYAEIIPVIKISKTKDALNITDLSLSHVTYIKKKLKNKKLIDEIRLAKAFCYANKCYGAESYINGFSGYSLELLILYYKSFLKFVKEMSKYDSKKGKIIIDSEKLYKNKKDILIDLNQSKTNSPIILIDPTYKQRNALAALNKETFDRFVLTCKAFMRNPKISFFELEKTDLKRIKENSTKNKLDFLLLEAKTNKQEGDIAGSKLFKFYCFLIKEIQKYFILKDKGFNYNDQKSARYYFVAIAKKEIVMPGPLISLKEHAEAFEKAHPNYSIKDGRLRYREKVGFNLKEFISKWKLNNLKKIKGMYIEEIKVMN